MFGLLHRVRDQVHHFQVRYRTPAIAYRLAWNCWHLGQNGIPIVLAKATIPSTATENIANLEPQLYSLGIGRDLNVDRNRAGWSSRRASRDDRLLIKLLARVEPDESPDLPNRHPQPLPAALRESGGIIIDGEHPSSLDITAARLRPVAKEMEP